MLPLTRGFRTCVHRWREMIGRKRETGYRVELVFVTLIWDRHLFLNIQRYCLNSTACAGRATNHGRLRSLCRYRTRQSSSKASLVTKTYFVKHVLTRLQRRLVYQMPFLLLKHVLIWWLKPRDILLHVAVVAHKLVFARSAVTLHALRAFTLFLNAFDLI